MFEVEEASRKDDKKQAHVPNHKQIFHFRIFQNGRHPNAINIVFVFPKPVPNGKSLVPLCAVFVIEQNLRCFADSRKFCLCDGVAFVLV